MSSYSPQSEPKKITFTCFGSCLELILQYINFSYFLGFPEWTTEPCSSVLVACVVSGSTMDELGKMAGI